MNPLPRLLGLLPRSWLKAAARLQWRNRLLKAAFDRVRGAVVRNEGPIRQGVARGLLFSADGSNAGYLLGTSEPHVQRALELLLRPGMTVWDIGANIGFFSVLIQKLVGPRGRVVAFDPLAENVARIKHNAAINSLPGIIVQEIAVGAEDGTASFVVSEVSSWGRLKSAGESARKTGEVDVPVRTLDSLAGSGTLPAPDFIKIDVEGAEEFVLRGGSETIARLKPTMLIELHGTNEAVSNSLADLGYESLGIGHGNQAVTAVPWNAHLLAFPGDTRIMEPAVERELRSADILS